MKNFDLDKTITFDEAKKNLHNAIKQGNDDQQQEAFMNLMTVISNQVTEEAKASIGKVNEQFNDSQILAKRGLRRALTSEETKFFNAVVEKNTFEVGLEFPVTIVEDVLSQIETEHEILSKVDRITVKGIVEFRYGVPGKQRGFWGDICEDIRQIILDGFKKYKSNVFKLSGFVVLCKGMAELGPNWLVEYVMRSLREIITITLEEAIVNGEGAGANQPVGMMRQLTGAVDGIHPLKTETAITDFNATTLAGFRASLAKNRTGNGQISLLVNPETYWAKMYPKLMMQTPTGEWVLTRMPNGEEIIQSYAVPVDKFIIGNLKNYLLVINSQIKIEKYDQTFAIEDLDLYIAKFFGDGMPKHPNAFYVGDVSGIEAIVQPVDEVEATEPVVTP